MNSLIPPVLNPTSLYKEEAKRDATRIRTYNIILNSIYNRIKATARVPGSTKAIWYELPELVPGTPRFDMGDAVLYIVWNLRNSGYFVEYTAPNGLYVSWRAHDEYYKHVESPWTQVLHTARKAVLEGEATASVMSIAVPAPSASLATPPEIAKRKSVLKKTLEYTPPASSVPTTSTNPGIVSAMYASAAPAVPQLRLPGQLSEKHVSFV